MRLSAESRYAPFAVLPWRSSCNWECWPVPPRPTYTLTPAMISRLFSTPPARASFVVCLIQHQAKIKGSISFSAPLGDNYEGNPSATMLSYNFTDGVGPQSAAGDTSGGGLGFPYVMDSTFGTDSSGNIVSWNFAVTGFSPSGILTKGIQTENDSGNVVDSGNVDFGGGDRRGGVSVSRSGCVGGNQSCRSHQSALYLSRSRRWFWHSGGSSHRQRRTVT